MLTQCCGALQSSSVIGAAAAAASKKVATGSPDGADGLRAVSSYVDNLRRASRASILRTHFLLEPASCLQRSGSESLCLARAGCGHLASVGAELPGIWSCVCCMSAHQHAAADV